MSGASRQRFGAEEARYRGPHRTLTTGKGIPNSNYSGPGGDPGLTLEQLA
jgi:hypothetical protein